MSEGVKVKARGFQPYRPDWIFTARGKDNDKYELFIPPESQAVAIRALKHYLKMYGIRCALKINGKEEKEPQGYTFL